MEFQFTKVKRVRKAPAVTKAEKLLKMMQNGERGSMEYFARKLKTSKDGVRSFVCHLRKQGHNIFNRAVDGSLRKTEYFLAKKGMQEQVVLNKVRHTMNVPKGSHILKIR